MTLGLRFINGPDNTSHQQNDIDNLTRVERHTECVDEEQLEPSSYSDDARHHTIKYSCQNHNRDAQGNQRALEVGIGETAIVPYQYDGGYA